MVLSTKWDKLAAIALLYFPVVLLLLLNEFSLCNDGILLSVKLSGPIERSCAQQFKI